MTPAGAGAAGSDISDHSVSDPDGGDRAGAPHVLLIGMMGAGKTTVGRLVSARLGWRYVDSDDEVQTMTGHTVKELFESAGEAAFRLLESRALAMAVVGSDPTVVSVAGGAVMDPDNRTLLRRAGTVVWLRASPATLAARVQCAEERPHRPLLGSDPAAAIARLDAERRPLYDELADVVVDVDLLAPDEVADRVMEMIPWRR